MSRSNSELKRLRTNMSTHSKTAYLVRELMTNSILSIIFLFNFATCSNRSISQLEKKGVHVDRSSNIKITNIVSDSLRFQYLGCGGFYFQQNDQAIMIDPYFSHQSFMRIGKSIFLGGKIKPMKNQLRFGKRMIKDSLNVSDEFIKSSVKGIFAAHGHYDHLMDVPFIQHEWLNGQADIFVNTSSAKTIANVIPSSKLRDIEQIASVRNQKGDSVEFHAGASAIRVYPIFADHNPHSRHLKLFAGSAVQAPRRYQSYSDKTSVNDWLEGQTLSFIVDFIKNDEIYFRIFIQSSSCQFPNGIPPQSLLREHKVDLAILGVASFQFSENSYPCEYLEVLKPGNLMFIHWEDFFRKVYQKPKWVKTNDIPRFFNEVFSKCKMDYMMPLPGAVFQISN
jgi:hypothetical protein